VSAEETQLEFIAASKWYGQIAALSQVTVQFKPGVVGLVGQNGAGKSTLLKLACGLLRPSQGEVRVCGGSPTDASVRRCIGYCSDLDRYYEHLTGRVFVTWMLRLAGLGRSQAAQRAVDLLEELGLGGEMDRTIAGYSKGMRQRVKLAQALGHDPAVMLLDEPLTGLDPVARHEVGELIRGLGDRGRVVLVSSHVLHELQAVAERVVLIHQGRLLAEGTVDELREQLDHQPRKLFLRSDDPRALASRLFTVSQVSSVAVAADGVNIETAGGHGVHENLTQLGADGLVLEIVPRDDSLDSVFGYLVS
jgi:ABC-2 type transport system ATP-binding protein